LTKGICRESLCPIQTLPKLIQVKLQSKKNSLKYFNKLLTKIREQVLTKYIFSSNTSYLSEVWPIQNKNLALPEFSQIKDKF
jgi:hypothetical protein